MSRRRRNGQSRRGEHKKALSPETRAWNREHLIPERPTWMDADVYRRLAELRSKL